jgi:hypothetical protein
MMPQHEFELEEISDRLVREYRPTGKEIPAPPRNLYCTSM